MGKNHGPTVDPGPITVTDVLPEGLSFASSSDDTVQVDGQTVTWMIEAGLQVGETVTLDLEVRVGDAAYPAVDNTVTIDTPTTQTPDAKLTDSEIVTVHAASTLR